MVLTRVSLRMCTHSVNTELRLLSLVKEVRGTPFQNQLSVSMGTSLKVGGHSLLHCNGSFQSVSYVAVGQS